MSQPTPYSRLYNFTDYQTVNPTKPLPATNLDAELNAVELTLDETLTNLAQIQRDDGKLVNQVVTPESLSAATLAIISQGEYNPRGNWAASTAYAVGDLVTYNAATYLCITANTSTPSFATDNSAGYWLLIANGALQGGGQAVDTFSGNAAQTTFTLSYAYASSNAATVFVAGVAQIPTQDFTIVGTTLTFVSAPPSPSVAGRKNIMVRGTGVEAQLAADLANTASADAQGYAAAALSSKNAAAASQTAAAASQTAAATSATAAAASQSAASTSQTAAAGSATAAASSASAASSSQTAAATSATNAAASATSASTSATTATTKATEASTSATNAATSATSAAASATTATTKAADATTAANNAATSATAAGSSSTSAASSATSATNSATTATNAATTATQQASNASSSATSANTSATNAATSATSAASSATAAASSASSASTSATTATTQASNASTSATAAAASAASAASSLDAFKKNYQGASATAPTTRYDGSALQVGDLYFNTTTNAMQVRASSGWTNAGSSVNGTSRRFEFVATAGQTTFTGADSLGNTLAYDAGFIDVYLNGSRLKSTDFTATSGTSVVLAGAASALDEVNIVAYGTFQVANLNGQDLQANTVTYSKIQTVTAGKVLGRDTSGSGVVQELPIAVDSSGNVGIGTNSPTHRLSITNTSSSGFAAARFTADSRAYDVGVGGSASGFQQNNFYVFDATASAALLVLDTSGNMKFNSGYGSVATAYGCRAWVNTRGDCTINASGNVSSCVDFGAAFPTQYMTVNLTTAMPDRNYAITSGFGGLFKQYNTGEAIGDSDSPSYKATGWFNVDIAGTSASSDCMFAIFR